jgi:hypothetical protein
MIITQQSVHFFFICGIIDFEKEKENSLNRFTNRHLKRFKMFV